MEHCVQTLITSELGIVLLPSFANHVSSPAHSTLYNALYYGCMCIFTPPPPPCTHTHTRVLVLYAGCLSVIFLQLTATNTPLLWFVRNRTCHMFNLPDRLIWLLSVRGIVLIKCLLLTVIPVVISVLLIMAGDVEQNPGPKTGTITKYNINCMFPCTKCSHEKV